MRIGIVGCEAAKFTPETESLAKTEIMRLLAPGDVVISGGCHLGGIDIWAADIGRNLDFEVIEHSPRIQSWPGYRARNLKIVEDSDQIVCITVKELPPDYKGRASNFCYHCKTDTHVSSGGCWTMKQGRLQNKLTQLIVISETTKILKIFANEKS